LAHEAGADLAFAIHRIDARSTGGAAGALTSAAIDGAFGAVLHAVAAARRLAHGGSAHLARAVRWTRASATSRAPCAVRPAAVLVGLAAVLNAVVAVRRLAHGARAYAILAVARSVRAPAAHDAFGTGEQPHEDGGVIGQN
jgi:hypothetical protein